MKSLIRSIGGSVLALMLAATLGASNASADGSEKKRFSDLQVVRFAKPVTAPDFRLQKVTGDEVSFSQFKGKVVLVNFWTTW